MDGMDAEHDGGEHGDENGRITLWFRQAQQPQQQKADQQGRKHVQQHVDQVPYGGSVREQRGVDRERHQ